MTSIRRFLIIVSLATITLFNFVAALQSYQAGMKKSELLFDGQLHDMANLLADASSNEKEVQAYSGNDNIAFQIWQEDGELLQRSGNMPAGRVIPLKEGFSHASFNGYRWRTFTHQNNSNSQWLVIAERSDARSALAENIILTSVLPIVSGLPVLGILIWLIIGSGLKPLDKLATELGSKKPSDLSPLQKESIPVELAQLVKSINGLLHRLEESFERERRFSGDAAHELRTPLSALKVNLYHIAESLPKDHESLPLLNASVDRMTHIIEQMLLLHRTTPDQFVANFTHVDLYTLVQKVVSDNYRKISDKNQSIELEGDHCTIIGDEFALSTLVKNLVDNANKYTPENGSIVIAIKPDSGHAVLSVEDSGVGIPEALRERVFERFYRVDGDQHSSSTEGCGLGFSIIKHIIDLHHGRISLSASRFASGLKVTVELPIELSNELHIKQPTELSVQLPTDKTHGQDA